MKLPEDQNVNVSLLSSVFNNTTATYKFYWFLSIIECVEEGKDEIEKCNKINVEMQDLVWTVRRVYDEKKE